MAQRVERVAVQPAPFREPSPDGDIKWVGFGVGHGLSESDFVARQRYFENSGPPHTCSHAVSVASQPATPPPNCSSHELHCFIQEQRKIISTFRAQPWPMQMKLSALRSYKRNISKYVPQLNTIDTFMDSSGELARKLRQWGGAVCETLTLWRTIIKKIEGNFGTSVASFFIFLRWLCALNLFLAILILCFIILPQSMLGHGLEVPESVRENGTALSFVVDGKGYLLEYSVLFYGYYDSGQNEPHLPPPPNPSPYLMLHYKLPLAYLLVSSGFFVIFAVALLIKMAKKYKMMQRAIVGERFPFSWKVFSSWDFAITNTSAAQSKKKQITVSLKETVVEARGAEEPQVKHIIILWATRIFSNAVILLSLAATSYAIYLAVDNTESVVHRRDFHQTISQGTQGFTLLLASFQVQVVIMARNFLLPYVFSLAEMLEKHHPRTALKMMLVRMFLLYLSSLYVLIIALFTLSTHCKRAPGGSEEGEEEVVDESVCCWETIIGQELFKLTLTHFMADLASIAVDGARWLLPRIRGLQRLEKWIAPTEFRLADNILRLIYGQALIMLGVLFCPLLPGISLMKNVLLFYCRAWAVYFFNQPPRTLFRVASTINFYLGLLLVTVFLCSLPVGYALVQMTPSETCGPFRGLTNMLHIVLDEIETWPSPLQVAIDYMRTATVLIPLLALLGILIYYYAALSHALKEVNKDLKLQLRMEHAEARQTIAKKANPRPDLTPTVHRHLQLQNALTSELKAKNTVPHNPMQAEHGAVTPPSNPPPPPPPSPHSHSHPPLPHHPQENGENQYLPAGWRMMTIRSKTEPQSAIFVEPPRAPLSNLPPPPLPPPTSTDFRPPPSPHSSHPPPPPPPPLSPSETHHRTSQAKGKGRPL